MIILNTWLEKERKKEWLFRRYANSTAICKGNKNWNLSAPHGAGRLMSRTEARKKISLEDFKNSMTNIYSETVNSSTIDESPFCYKDHNEIIEQIGETVDIIEKLKVIANFKGY